MTCPSDDDVQRALRAAQRYRSLGLNPLPSRMDIKGPMLPTYAAHWASPLPDSTFESWATTNIQLMTGTHWRICVVDCDGDEAEQVWAEMRAHHGSDDVPATWMVRTGGGGLHTYFTLPGWLDECPSRRLWGVWDTWAGPRHRGDWMKHREVRLLGDKALAIAPPSIHVTTGQRYEFIAGHSPIEHPRPAQAPGWLLRMPTIQNPSVAGGPSLKLAPAPKAPGSSRTFFPREEVLEGIGVQKAALARSWGLRFASREANANGWYSVYAIDRDDRAPSASFNAQSGVYMEQREGTRLAFFDLAVALGAYEEWRIARDDLGSRYVARARPRV